MTIELLNLLFTFGGTLLGFGGTMLFKSGRRKASAEADKTTAEAVKAMSDAYESRISALHSIAEKNNETELAHATRIKELNLCIDDKVAEIRRLNTRLWETEQQNTRIAEENGQLKEELANTRCHVLDCHMRQPPNKHTKEAIAKAAALTGVKTPVKTKPTKK